MVHTRPPDEPYKNMICDPCPQGGYPPPKKRAFPESNWDEAQWPQTRIPATKLIRKTAAKAMFKLRDEDFSDLHYFPQYGPPGGRRGPPLVLHKRYFRSECERRAWEVYGGPSGLNAAVQKSIERSAQRVARRLGHNPIATPQAPKQSTTVKKVSTPSASKPSPSTPTKKPERFRQKAAKPSSSSIVVLLDELDDDKTPPPSPPVTPCSSQKKSWEDHQNKKPDFTPLRRLENKVRIKDLGGDSFEIIDSDSD